MKARTFFGMWVALLCICGLAGCKEEEFDVPTFVFDDNGVCYSSSVVPVSQEDFECRVVGYGWKHVSTYEIGHDGQCVPEDYYKDLIGIGPEWYYFESASSLKSYMYVDAYPAWGFMAYNYRLEEANRIMVNDKTYMQLLSVDGDVMRIVKYLGVHSDGDKIYGYATYRRMTAEELEEVQDEYDVNLSEVVNLTLSVKDNPVIVSGKEFEFDVLASNGVCVFEAFRDGYCNIITEGNHVKVELLKNGVKLTGSDKLMHCGISIYSTDEELEPEGTDIYDFDYTEIVLTEDKRLVSADGDNLYYEFGGMEVHPRNEYFGSILSRYSPVALLVVDENKEARYLRLRGGKIYFNELLPQDVLDSLAAGNGGDSINYKLELISAGGDVFQVLPFKVVYQKKGMEE